MADATETGDDQWGIPRNRVWAKLLEDAEARQKLVGYLEYLRAMIANTPDSDVLSGCYGILRKVEQASAACELPAPVMVWRDRTLENIGRPDRRKMMNPPKITCRLLDPFGDKELTTTLPDPPSLANGGLELRSQVLTTIDQWLVTVEQVRKGLFAPVAATAQTTDNAGATPPTGESADAGDDERKDASKEMAPGAGDTTAARADTPPPDTPRPTGIKQAAKVKDRMAGTNKQSPMTAGTFDELAEWTASNLKMTQAAMVKTLIEHGGRLPVPDLQTLAAIGDFNRTRQRVNKMLRKVGWRVIRHDNEARLEQLGGRQK